MATNPAYNFGSFDSHGAGAYRYDPQNDAQVNGRHRQNFFDNSEHRFMTARFADVTPFLAFDCVPGDRHTFKTNMRLRSYTLASPLMSTLTMSKDYYAVPLSCIIPNAFEKFYANPIKGDDVPQGVYCFGQIPYRNLLSYIGSTFNPASGGTSVPDFDVASFRTSLAYFALFLNIVSSGSLLSSLGYHANNLVMRYVADDYLTSSAPSDVPSRPGIPNPGKFGYNYYFQSFDEFFDKNRPGLTFDSVIIPNGTTTFVTKYNFTFHSITLIYKNHPIYGSSSVFYDLVSPKGFRKFIDDLISGSLYLDTSSFPRYVASYSNTAEEAPTLHSFSDKYCFYYLFPLDKYFGYYASGSSFVQNTNQGLFCFRFSLQFDSANNGNNVNCWFYAPLDSSSIDLSYLVAYHLIMAQFFSVDAIDNIYTAKMWMENAYTVSFQPSTKYFQYNGLEVPYDIFSNTYFFNMCNLLLSPGSNFSSIYPYFSNLFCYENSLSYGDYFNGGRLEPLAVGDVNITGVGNSSNNNVTVNALDVTRNLQFQRFLNKVNRTGAAIWDYIRGIQGHIPVQIDPMPRFIAHESCVISGFEVENTTAGDISNPTTQQGYPVTMLNSGESKFAFDIEVGGDPCVVLGLMSFDMRRAYSSTVDRAFFKRDRFDFFQPDLQNIGDQVLYFGELSPCYPKFSGFLAEYPFAYHLRDTHYKQRYPVAFGGFTRQDILPSWANVIDFANYDYVGDGLNSEMIRNHNSDFDKFFQSLNGVTLSSYFHFIISIDNQLGSYREMQVKPLIAG